MLIDCDITPVIDWLNEITARCENPEPAFDQAEQRIYQSIETSFRAGGRPTWPPRKRSYPHPPLIKSGALLSSSTGGGMRQFQKSVQGSTLEVGPDIFYAGYQHEGTYDKSPSPQAKGIAPRPWMYYQDDDIDVIADIFLNFLCP